MEAVRIVLSSVAALFLAAGLGGQNATSTWVAGLLPAEARVIETADVRVDGRTDRALVLWMFHPKRVVRAESGDLGCADWVYGDHWYGPTQLSLLDLTNKRLINTIEVRGMYEGSGEKEHGFPIPFVVSNDFYYVPQVNKNKEGAAKILHLKDFTGEGVAGQFVLFEYEVCSVNLTTVLGYSRKSDRAVHYGVETVSESGKPETTLWIAQVFGAKPVRPGHWEFHLGTWARS